MLGHDYGSEMQAQSTALSAIPAASLFFRDVALETLPAESKRHALAVADQIMLGVVGASETMAQSRHP